jgi:hypothetical protein
MRDREKGREEMGGGKGKGKRGRNERERERRNNTEKRNDEKGGENAEEA